MQIRLLPAWILMCCLMIACESSRETSKKSKSPRIKNAVKFLAPKNGLRAKIGTVLDIEWKENYDSIKVDSIIVTLSNGAKSTITSNRSQISTTDQRVGKQYMDLEIFLNNGKKENQKRSITLQSDVTPNQFTYRIVNTFTHDPDDYTQGLFIDNGFIYENTGHEGESQLKQIDWKSGKVLKSIDLESEYFGEGITLLDNKIYQLTWQTRIGFIYDKNTFERTGSFNYSTEGWGLTTDGQNLIMSDGTQNIYFMEPDGFAEVDRIQAYDENGPIDRLNELEYIDGKIYANRYEYDLIYIIDPESGKVEGIINLEGIFNKANYNGKIDVLNGIAYDKDTKLFYVTGKWWPKLFEIELIKKEQNNNIQ